MTGLCAGITHARSAVERMQSKQLTRLQRSPVISSLKDVEDKWVADCKQSVDLMQAPAAGK
jgi:hypothetical protein